MRNDWSHGTMLIYGHLQVTLCNILLLNSNNNKLRLCGGFPSLVSKAASAGRHKARCVVCTFQIADIVIMGHIFKYPIKTSVIVKLSTTNVTKYVPCIRAT